MQILNVDALVTPTRSITLDSVDHVVKDLDVQQFIDNLAAAEQLDAQGAESPKLSQAVREGVAALAQALPSVPKERLMKLPVAAISKMLQFVRGELDPINKAPADGAQAEGSAEKKPT
jgi:hypothetical protein